MMAIILSRQNIREADQLITLFSYERGKEMCAAKSVKKIVSKNSPFLEPGVIAEVDAVPAHEFPRLIRATALRIGKEWRTDLEKLFLVQAVLRIVERAIPLQTPEQAAFCALEAWLEFLDTPVSYQEALDAATKTIFILFCALGFRPVLVECVQGHAFDGAPVFFDPLQGGAVCAPHRQPINGVITLAPSELMQLKSLESGKGVQVSSAPLPDKVHAVVWSLGSHALENPLPRWWRSEP